LKPRFFYGWVIVAIACVSSMLIYGIRHSFSVFFAPILNEFGWSRGSISIMLSLNIFFYGFLAPVAGALADRWGARKMMPVGILILALATAGCGFAEQLGHFYLLFGVLAPLGSAFSGWPIFGPAIVQWFEKRRGLVIGLGQMGGGLSFVSMVFVEFCIGQVGWRNTFFILGATLVLILLPLYYFFFYYRPGDKGLTPYGANVTEEIKNSKNRSSLLSYPKIKDWTLGEILRTRELWFLIASYSLFWGMGIYMVLAHQVKFAQDAGYSSLFSVSVFALFGITLFLGQLSGFLSDWIGREKTTTLAAAACLMALVALISVDDTSKPWLLYLFSVCFGYGCGLFTPTVFAAAADLFFGKFYGTVAGLLLSGMGVGGILGPWLGGYLFDIMGSYKVAFMICMGSIFSSCIFVWLAAPRKTLRVDGKK
jgi:sugar phosphate permease